MDLSRRDFLKATSAMAAALGLHGSWTTEALAAEGATPVLWLQGQGCTGCSVSFLNSVYYATVDGLLTQSLDLNYHSVVMAAAGQQAIQAAKDTAARKGYVLVVEGAVPVKMPKACYAWAGTTVLDALKQLAPNAGYILAVGSCAAYGGIPSAKPNPTGARSVKSALNRSVINIPGCPAHPDWVVGTIAYIQKYGKAPALDSSGRPTDYFARTVHSRCPLRDDYEEDQSGTLGVGGCLRHLGCRGPETRGDCPSRRWNAEVAGGAGVAFCTTSGAPCHGCTENGFPESFDPLYRNLSLAPGAGTSRGISSDAATTTNSSGSGNAVTSNAGRSSGGSWTDSVGNTGGWSGFTGDEGEE